MALTKVTSGLISADASSVDLNIDAGTLYIDSTNNRVGVGTTSPGVALQVHDSLGTTLDDGVLRLIDDTSYAQNVGAALALGFKYNSSGNVIQRGGVIKAIKENATDGNYASALLFGTTANAASTTERMRIDSSGNVGIGTSSPNAALDILGATSDQLRLRTTEAEEYKIGRNHSTGFLEFYGTQSGYIGYVFSGANGERMRITSAGQMLLGGTTNPQGSKLLVAGGAGSTAEFTSTGITYFFFTSTETGGQSWSFRTAGTGNYGSGNGDLYIVNGSGSTFLQFDTSAGTVNGDLVDTSDIGLKENITDTTDGLDKILQLRPRKFDWIEENKANQINGFIAQEVETVLPNEVTGDDYDPENPEHGRKGLNTSGILAVAVKAIQEQQVLIEQLQAEVALLKGE